MRYSTTSVTLVWILSFLHAVNAVSLSLTAQGADHKFHSLGTVELTPEKSEFIAGALALEPGYYCVGTKDLPGHECFTYTYLDGGMDHKAVQVTVDNGQVMQLALIHNEDEKAVKIVSAAVGPNPNMDPVPLQSKKKKAVQQEEKEDGEEVEKSWIQKNWMYIVPPLMILMMLLPADEEKK